MAMYRQINFFAVLEESEGDPEVQVEPPKEPTKKHELGTKQAVTKKQESPVKRQDSAGAPKPEEKKLPQPIKEQNKKPENKDTKGQSKGDDKQKSQRPNNNTANTNKNNPNAASNTAKPQAPAAVVVAVDPEPLFEGKPSGQRHTKPNYFENVKHDRKPHSNLNTSVKKGGEGRRNWGGEGKETVADDRSRATKNRGREFSETVDKDEATTTQEPNPESSKEGQSDAASTSPAAAAVQGGTNKEATKPEDNTISYNEWMEGQKDKVKAKAVLPLPKLRQAGEGEEEGKWKDKKYVEHNKKTDSQNEKKKGTPEQPSSPVEEDKKKKKSGDNVPIEITIPKKPNLYSEYDNPQNKRRDNNPSNRDNTNNRDNGNKRDNSNKRGNSFNKRASSGAPAPAVSVPTDKDFDSNFPALQNANLQKA